MGPQHPSTHGVLRLVLELEGETVTDCRVVIGYLHTGIEKNTEYRTWTQGVTFLTRADYLAPFFNETVYCLGVEKLLGIEAPARAQLIRIMMMEINRVSSHTVWLATGGLELGALTAMTNGMRMREKTLDIFELITGLRMNHAYVRPGGVAQDLPEGAIERVREWCKDFRKELDGVDKLLRGQTIWVRRLKDTGWIGVEGCLALGVTGPILRAAGLPGTCARPSRTSATRRSSSRCRPMTAATTGRGSWSRSPRCASRSRSSSRCSTGSSPARSWSTTRRSPGRRSSSLGPDGLGNSLPHVQKIMNTSMESLIHHFKLVTEGFRVPAGQVYTAIESPRGELGAHVVSDGGTRPYRVHFREPSFINLQSTAALSVGGLIADVIASVASIDPVMGGCDR